jgi:membrane-associated phospholipid phosphatase
LFFYLFFLTVLAIAVLDPYLILLYLTLGFATFISGFFNRMPYRSFQNFLAKFGLSFIVISAFSSLGQLIPQISSTLYDAAFLRMDIAIFGVNPVIWIAENAVHPLLTEWLQLSYFLYFFFVLGSFLLAYFQEREKESDFVLFSLSLGFLLSYIGYILFPALGPRDPAEEVRLSADLLVRYPNSLEGIVLTPYLRDILATLEKIKRNAFPSGHTALTIIALRHYYLLNRKLFYFFLPTGISIILATVYCRYHYVVDVIAGVIFALLIIAWDRKLCRFFQRLYLKTKVARKKMRDNL